MKFDKGNFSTMSNPKHAEQLHGALCQRCGREMSVRRMKVGLCVWCECREDDRAFVDRERESDD